MANLDVCNLIELVRLRPCLWDKKGEQFRNKLLRHNAWTEICLYLIRDYNDRSEEDKSKTMTAIIAKWTNVRDAFMKSLKFKSGQPVSRKYVYHRYLQFLLKMSDPDAILPNDYVSSSQEDIQSPLEQKPNIEFVSNYDRDNDFDMVESYDESESLHAWSKRRKPLDPIEKEHTLNVKRDEKFTSDDESFLVSLLPTLYSFSADEKIDFRIEVLNVIKKIIKKRKT